jgi:hypothetical protein
LTRRRVIFDVAEINEKDGYPSVCFPNKGCIVRSIRSGRLIPRGYKEEAFEQKVKEYFGSSYDVLGDACINTGAVNKPFQLDIALLNKKEDSIRLNIEIDEPYQSFSRTVTHCEGDDVLRDQYFTDRGWIVLRFSERQVQLDLMGCIKHVGDILAIIDPKYEFTESLKAVKPIENEPFWSVVQAQNWERLSIRESYLETSFVPEKHQDILEDRSLNVEEQDEEALVVRSFNGTIEQFTNTMNPHSRDDRIEFSQASHSYFLDKIPVKSASHLVAKFFTEFDSYGAAKKLKPSNPLYGKSVDEIVLLWSKKGQEASHLGTLLHEQIENYYTGAPYESTSDFERFLRFAKDHSELQAYRCEWRIFDEDFHIAGTIDFIAKNKGVYEMYDWKRSKKVVDSRTGQPIAKDYWGKKGIGKLRGIDDTSYNHYCLQQSIYKFILEKNYGLQISKMFLVVIHPELDGYFKVEVPYLKNYVEYMLNTL